MTAFFGIDERNAQDFLDKSIVCYPHSPDGISDLHSIVSAIKSEDIVFIKHCAPQSSLRIKAVGVVRSDYPTESDLGVCLPVEWVWQGEKVLENFDEELSLCGNALYEEHNILVQREIINLLPKNTNCPKSGKAKTPSGPSQGIGMHRRRHQIGTMIVQLLELFEEASQTQLEYLTPASQICDSRMANFDP